LHSKTPPPVAHPFAALGRIPDDYSAAFCMSENEFNACHCRRRIVSHGVDQ
jgi:hypothetical protein